MTRRAISVTLQADNVTWLKARTGAGGVRSVSALLDQLVSAARVHGGVGPSRSVVGTVDIDPADLDLQAADQAVRRLFDASVARPHTVREARATYSVRAKVKKRRG